MLKAAATWFVLWVAAIVIVAPLAGSWREDIDGSA